MARRLTTGRPSDTNALRHALEDLWRDRRVNAAWQALSLRLTAPCAERIARTAAARGLAGPAAPWLPVPGATAGWARETGGYEAVVRPAVDSKERLLAQAPLAAADF